MTLLKAPLAYRPKMGKCTAGEGVLTMTVADLIDALKLYPSDMYVVVDGYEGGYDDPVVATHPAYRDVHLDKKKGWWWGAQGDYPENNVPIPVDCLVIGR